MSNSNIIKPLQDPPAGRPSQESVDWATIAIAVPREFKDRFERVARRMGLRPSQYGRTVLIEALGRIDHSTASSG